MPAPVFTQDDLLLPPDELSQLHVALANLGAGDPLATAVREATETVAIYTSRYILDDSTWRRLMRPLAIWSLYSQTGQVSETQGKARDGAMKELEGIRDGKFPLPLQDPISEGAPTGDWGSETKIATR